MFDGDGPFRETKTLQQIAQTGFEKERQNAIMDVLDDQNVSSKRANAELEHLRKAFNKDKKAQRPSRWTPPLNTLREKLVRAVKGAEKREQLLAARLEQQKVEAEFEEERKRKKTRTGAFKADVARRGVRRIRGEF